MESPEAYSQRPALDVRAVTGLPSVRLRREWPGAPAEDSNRMLRQSLLWLSRQNGLFNFIRSNPIARRFASRFVAGETIEESRIDQSAQ